MSRLSRLLSTLPFLAAAAYTSAVAAPAIQPRIESRTPTGYRAVVPIPAPQLTVGAVFGTTLTEISLPGGSADEAAGTPQLPTVTLTLPIPWDVIPRVAVRSGAPRSLGAHRPVPIPGLLTSPDVWKDLSPAELYAFLEDPRYAALPAGGARELLARAIPVGAGEACVLQITLRPFAWDPRSGDLTVVDEIALDVSWEKAPPGAAPEREAPSTRRAVLRAAGRAAAYSGPLRVEPLRPWVRLGVLRPGLYALSAADLGAAGVSTAGIDPATFRVFRATPADLPESVSVDLGPDSLRECAITVVGEGDGSFDPGDRVYFYATGRTGFGYDLALGGSVNYQEPQRADEEALWLTWGPGPVPPPPRRMATRDAAPVSALSSLTAVLHRVHYEENRTRDYFNLFDRTLRWERWFYRVISQGSRISFPLALPGAVPGGAGSLVVRMWGQNISVGSLVADHYTNIYWDKTVAASASWNFPTARDLVGTGFTVKAADTLDVEVPRVSDPVDPNRFDQSLLAWFEITYPRALSAINDTLQFAADSTAPGRVRYVLSGISDSTAVWLLDRTDPENPVRLVNGVVGGVSAPFTLTIEDSVGVGYAPRYTLVPTARAPRPATIARYAPASSPHSVADLLDPSNGADYLIVAPPAFLAAAESLAAYRSGRLAGFAVPRVAIATTDRIYAQLGGGAADHVAIRNLLAYARAHWTSPAPSYACLLGDATLDPKNYLGFASPDWVPAYSNYYDPALLSQFVSDDWYGFLDGPGDQVLDIAIGRLPARTTIEASNMVLGKLRAFEGSTELDPWRARALLSADDSWKREQRDIIGNGHVEDMERKDRQHLPYPVERTKVYLNDFAFSDTTHQSKPAAREEFIARVNEGNILVDYIGHGSDAVIADEQLFRSSDVARLTNASRPSVFAVMSCTVGKFDVTGQEGLAEQLLKSPTGGAVASVASTERVFPTQSTQLNDALVDGMFPLDPRVDSVATLGAAWMSAKNAHINSVTRKYVLLGDPGLEPPLPRGRGVWEKAPLDSILRGEVATLRGRALNSDGSIDTLTSGTALIQIQGKQFDRVQIGLNNLSTLVPFTYHVPGPLIYRGEVSLDRGAFEARFVVPMDGRIGGGVGQLRALLSGAGGLGVGLAVDSIRIAQGAASRADQAPPAITLRYPAGSDSTVTPGTRLTIVLEDSSGIDLMRLDNAHTIFLILDDRGSPTEITKGFAYEPGSYTRGSVDYVVPALSEGLHTLEVHASDSYGNIAIRMFVLDVHSPAAAGDPVQLTQIFNYPNPFAGQTYFHARVNQAARIRVQVFTVAGRQLRELSLEGKAGENYIPWDGKDSVGENVAIGVYVYKVTAETSYGKRASAVGRALRTK